MSHVQPIRCMRCDRQPAIVPIEVYYHTPRRKGVHDMWRVQCSCGTIGKCRPSKATAAEAWNEPWQAFVSPISPIACPHYADPAAPLDQFEAALDSAPTPPTDDGDPDEWAAIIPY